MSASVASGWCVQSAWPAAGAVRSTTRAAVRLGVGAMAAAGSACAVVVAGAPTRGDPGRGEGEPAVLDVTRLGSQTPLIVRQKDLPHGEEGQLRERQGHPRGCRGGGP
jgi:hypothetical protein